MPTFENERIHKQIYLNTYKHFFNFLRKKIEGSTV